MVDVATVDRWFGLLTLRESRRFVRARFGRLVAGGIAVAFAVASMLVSGMLAIYAHPAALPSQVVVLWGNPLGVDPWNYPAILATGSWGVLSLPFLATVTMVLVSAGVGLGAAVSALLLAPLLRNRRRARRDVVSASTIGATPTIAGLGLLGACCCTSCLTTASVPLIAAASGASLSSLLLNDWYVNVFQVAIVFLALVAQERALERATSGCPTAPPSSRRLVGSIVLRVLLFVAGVTWSLAMFVEWGSVSPASAGLATWYHWIVEHQLLSLTAVAAAIFPDEFVRGVRRIVSRSGGWFLRGPLLVGAVTWGLWVPPSLASLGLGGLLNELFGYLALPSSWGAVPPDAPLGAALLFHWVFQHALLSGFGLVLALRPRLALAPLEWSIGVPVAAGGVPSGTDRPRPTPSSPAG